MSKDPNSLKTLATGSGDGVVKVWDIQTKDEVWQAAAHQNTVKGVAWTQDKKLLTCGADRYIKLFDVCASWK
jgi:WD repeat and SOF domain-containing protein 1